MKKLIVVLLLIVICCSACSSPFSDESQDASEITFSSSDQLNENNSAVSLPENGNDDLSSSSAQEDTSIKSDTSATPDYQDLTQEQWNKLQDQKEKYGDWLLQKRENEAYSGEVDCPKFIHLW